MEATNLTELTSQKVKPLIRVEEHEVNIQYYNVFLEIYMYILTL